MSGKKAIKDLAKREGVSVNKIRKEIKIAIEDAYSNPSTRMKWTALFGEGVIPTPEQFIEVVSEDLTKSDFLLRKL